MGHLVTEIPTELATHYKQFCPNGSFKSTNKTNLLTFTIQI